MLIPRARSPGSFSRSHNVRRHRRIDAVLAFEGTKRSLHGNIDPIDRAGLNVVDFGAHRRPIAKGSCGLTGGSCPATQLDRFDGDPAKSGGLKISFDQRRIVIAKRTFAQEKGRSLGEKLDKCLLRRGAELIPVDLVPDRKQIVTLRAQYASRFEMRSDPVGEKHRPKLANDKIEAVAGERKLLSVFQLEMHGVGEIPFPRDIDHGLIEVGRDDLGVGQRLVECFGKDSGSGGCFEDFSRRPLTGTAGEFVRIGLKDERNHQPVVVLRYRAREPKLHPLHECGLVLTTRHLDGFWEPA